MPKFWAAYPHPAGVFQAKEEPITGENRADVLQQARSKCPFDRYLSSIYTDGRTMVWQESDGWTNAGKNILPH